MAAAAGVAPEARLAAAVAGAGDEAPEGAEAAPTGNPTAGAGRSGCALDAASATDCACACAGAKAGMGEAAEAGDGGAAGAAGRTAEGRAAGNPFEARELPGAGKDDGDAGAEAASRAAAALVIGPIAMRDVILSGRGQAMVMPIAAPARTAFANASQVPRSLELACRLSSTHASAVVAVAANACAINLRTCWYKSALPQMPGTANATMAIAISRHSWAMSDNPSSPRPNPSTSNTAPTTTPA